MSPSMLSLMLFALPAQVPAADEEPRWPRTRAEITDYRETSSHAEVLAFIDRLQELGAGFVVETLGVSMQGKTLPLVVVSSGGITTPSAARREGRVVVYVQANIHGGEVEGKESSLALLRELARGEHAVLLDRLVLLFAPIYNADGNDAFGPGDRNRPSDNGPETVGLRPNGMGLDLNRDCMKAESPEMRGVLANVYGRWDPEVVLDLHTTDGTRHGYVLTYSPPLAPDTESGLLGLVRDRLLPSVRRRMRVAHGQETFDYGNFRRDREERPGGWFTFEPHGRFVSNYAGLRNRIGILSEATSYRPFQERVAATRHFVLSVLGWVASHAEEVRATIRDADRRVAGWSSDPRGPELGLRFEHAARGRETVLLEELADRGGERSTNGRPRLGAPEKLIAVETSIYAGFRATRRGRLPRTYALAAEHRDAVALLIRHGIIVEALESPWQGAVQEFRIDALNTGERPFQGHRLHAVEGAWLEPRALTLPAGTFLVRTAQPLAILAFHLLEPGSLDGVTAWGFLDGALVEGQAHPVRSCAVEPSAVRRRVRALP